MTKPEIKELMSVMQAYLDGKTVQVTAGDAWGDYKGTCPDFLNPNWKWRIKPEPREFWVVEGCGAYTTKAQAEWHGIPIHVREVV